MSNQLLCDHDLKYLSDGTQIDVIWPYEAKRQPCILTTSGVKKRLRLALRAENPDLIAGVLQGVGIEPQDTKVFLKEGKNG